MGETPIKLNLGAGDTKLDGYIAIDRRFGQEVYPLPHGDNSVAAIRASHILEHFSFQELDPVLTDWVRTLEPGGAIEIAVPDFVKIQQLRETDPKWHLYLMGGQTNSDDYHKSVFTEPVLRALMHSVGLINLELWESDGKDTACHPVSLNLRGYKSREVPAETSEVAVPQVEAARVEVVDDGGDKVAPVEELRELKVEIPRGHICAVISMPRLAFTDNMFCAMGVLKDPRRQINIIKVTGAYWGQCLERGMTQVVESGAEWIVTMDYDTIFSGTAFDTLCFLMQQHPEADAIAPIQMKREGEKPMLFDETAPGVGKMRWEVAEFDPDITRLKHAHFGLTFFRVASLLKMPHPWFWSQPNKDGRWEEGRQDADIYFWNQWAKTGNTLYLANHVPIGHLQLMATWPTEDLRPHHQFVTDFYDHGVPDEARQIKIMLDQDNTENTVVCVVCGKALKGRQRKYCSDACKAAARRAKNTGGEVTKCA